MLAAVLAISYLIFFFKLDLFILDRLLHTLFRNEMCSLCMEFDRNEEKYHPFSSVVLTSYEGKHSQLSLVSCNAIIFLRGRLIPENLLTRPLAFCTWYCNVWTLGVQVWSLWVSIKPITPLNKVCYLGWQKRYKCFYWHWNEWFPKHPREPYSKILLHFYSVGNFLLGKLLQTHIRNYTQRNPQHWMSWFLSLSVSSSFLHVSVVDSAVLLRHMSNVKLPWAASSANCCSNSHF